MSEVTVMLRNTFFSLFLVVLLTHIAIGAPEKPSQQVTKNRTAPITVLSIIPANGEPGGSVTLYGSGFTEGTIAFLGNTQIPARVIGPKQLSFVIPPLMPGLYGLYLKRKDGTISSIYNFNVLPLKPVLTYIQPDRINACDSGGNREVQLRGYNFLESSMVMFDGAAIQSRSISPEAISFIVPDVSAGLHQVQVKNPDETQSATRALFIDTKPEITGISQGEERVNSYDLIVYGKNFQQDSSLVVDGTSYSGARSYPRPSGTEKIVYISCNQIVYERYPYDSTPKSIRLQVINVNGESSSVVQILAP
jgi:hypothetical protein